MSTSTAEVVVKPRRRGRWLWKLLAMIIIVFSAYTWFTLWWSYSNGERVGTLQKMSRKGWLCKTHEGELALYLVPGFAPQLWYFTVRDDVVAAQLDTLVGKRVRLHYSEHRGVPSSCFGDTPYFVESVSEAPL